MPLEYAKDRIRKAINTETGAVLTINGTPEIDLYRCVYSSKMGEIRMMLSIKEAPNELFFGNNPTFLPAICIKTSSLLAAFLGSLGIVDKFNLNADVIQNILYEMVTMIGFVTERYPITRNPCVWSDFEYAVQREPELANRLKGFVPLSRTLMKLSYPSKA